MKRAPGLLIVVFGLALLELPKRSEADCVGPAGSLLFEAEVASCSSAESMIREKAEEIAELRRQHRARRAALRGENSKAEDLAEAEEFVRKRLQTRDVIATLLIRRSRSFSGSSKTPSAAGDWQTIEDPKPEKYLVSIGTIECDGLPRGELVQLFAPYQCCDTFPGSNSCMLGLPQAVDVPESLLEPSRLTGREDR